MSESVKQTLGVVCIRDTQVMVQGAKNKKRKLSDEEVRGALERASRYDVEDAVKKIIDQAAE